MNHGLLIHTLYHAKQIEVDPYLDQLSFFFFIAKSNETIYLLDLLELEPYPLCLYYEIYAKFTYCSTRSTWRRVLELDRCGCKGFGGTERGKKNWEK